MLWEGRPQRGLMLRARDGLLIPFSLLWCGFAIFWEYQATFGIKGQGPVSIFFELWGAMFVAIGLYFVFGRFLFDAYIRAGTYYGVTNQRIMISSGLLRREVRSMFLAGLPEMRLSQSRDGRGTIKFGADPIGNRMSFSWTGSSVPAFEGIEDPANVYHVILKALKAAYADQ